MRAAPSHLPFALVGPERPAVRWGRRGVALLFVAGGATHVFLGTTMPDVYEPFADAAPWAFVREAWHDVFLAHPTVWALLLAAGEVTIGVLAGDHRGRTARAGLALAIAFHVALVAFGWGFLWWSAPMLVALGWLYHALDAPPLLPPRRGRHPRTVPATVAVLGFLGVAALGGGIEMVVARHGSTYLPADRLARIPVLDTYLVPGLVLATVFGLGALVTAVGMVRRVDWPATRTLEQTTGRHWSWTATVALGLAFTAWMALELVLLGGPWSTAAADRATAWATELAFWATALALLVLPQLPSVRRDLELPHVEPPDAHAPADRLLEHASRGFGLPE